MATEAARRVRCRATVAWGGVRDQARMATAGYRVLPDFLVLGAQKAGTTALIEHLHRHPDVVTTRDVELQYFSFRYGRGERWYRSNFPLAIEQRVARARRGRAPLVGEKTPYYLFHPRAAERAASLVPGAKLVALLRDPVTRAISHWSANRADGVEPLDLADALAAEERRTAPERELIEHGIELPYGLLPRYSYVARGRYAEQLDRWLEHVDPGRLLVVRAEDVWVRPNETVPRILDFLGLAPHDAPYRRVNEGRRPAPAAPAVREQLAATFAAPNADLACRYGISWGEPPDR